MWIGISLKGDDFFQLLGIKYRDCIVEEVRHENKVPIGRDHRLMRPRAAGFVSQ
jgi:hypothetical protein